MPEWKRRKTEIICTIGPASESPRTLEALIQAHRIWRHRPMGIEASAQAAHPCPEPSPFNR